MQSIGGLWLGARSRAQRVDHAAHTFTGSQDGACHIHLQPQVGAMELHLNCLHIELTPPRQLTSQYVDGLAQFCKIPQGEIGSGAQLHLPCGWRRQEA